MSKQMDVPELPEPLRPCHRARLRRVEGQLRGLARMVELGRPHAEILQQLTGRAILMEGGSSVALVRFFREVANP